MRRLRWKILGTLGLLLGLSALGFLLLVRRSFPQTQGTLAIQGLQEPVDIYRDSFGVPHIYASNPHDLFFALGYVHAQDRFWQMDVWRHTAAGRLSEMFGESQVKTDAFLRTLGWWRLAERDYQRLPEDVKAILDAYADGVNAYLAERQGSALSFEYAVLKLLNPDYEPEPWSPVHALAWIRVMAWDLRANMQLEIERAVLLKTYTPEEVAELFPPYPYDRHPVIVPEFTLSSEGTTRPPSESWFQIAALAEGLGQVIRQVDAVLGTGGTDLGSNSWAISGDLSVTGKPILANDPHLGQQLPSIWYQVGLHCQPKTEDCPYDVVGFSFAGAPGVIIGHNDRIAWGFTNVGADVMDLYIERINPENPNQYMVNGSWVDMEVRTEVIQVAGGAPVEITVRWTRHGPIISDVYKKLLDFEEKAGVDLPEEYALALRWTALEPTNTLQAILDFNKAQNWQEFREAARLFDVPAQNLLYADVEGNIGYQMPGKIPRRASGHTGQIPVPGWTDEYEWQGYIPFEELPWVLNPDKGYIVTANNPVVGPDYPYNLIDIPALGYRAKRIVDLIENLPKPLDVEDLARIQADNYDGSAAFLVPVMMELDLQDTHLEDIRELWKGWDYQMEADSPAAALYGAFWRHLLSATFHDDLPEDYWPKGGGRWFEVIRRLVAEADSPWWDDRTTPQKETRDDILRRAFADAVAELEERLGKNPETWAWGDLHGLLLTHPTLGKSGVAPIELLFNRGPYPTGGGAAIVNATGWKANEGYRVASLPSMRMLVDLADLSRSLAIHTTGQSGHAFHPHYVDMTDLWRTYQYHPMLWTQEQVLANLEGHLRLEPQK